MGFQLLTHTEKLAQTWALPYHAGWPNMAIHGNTIFQKVLYPYNSTIGQPFLGLSIAMGVPPVIIHFRLAC